MGNLVLEQVCSSSAPDDAIADDRPRMSSCRGWRRQKLLCLFGHDSPRSALSLLRVLLGPQYFGPCAGAADGAALLLLPVRRKAFG